MTVKINAAGATLLNDGVVGLPGLAFDSDNDTGIFRPAADILAVSANAIETARFVNEGNNKRGVVADSFFAVGDSVVKLSNRPFEYFDGSAQTIWFWNENPNTNGGAASMYARGDGASIEIKGHARTFTGTFLGQPLGTSAILRVENGSGFNVSRLAIGSAEAIPMYLGTSDVTRMEIAATGEVGVGGGALTTGQLTVYQTSTAKDGLTVRGGGNSTGGYVQEWQNAGGTPIGRFLQNSGAGNHYGQFYVGSTLTTGFSGSQLRVQHSTTSTIAEIYNTNSLQSAYLYLGQTTTRTGYIKYHGSGQNADGLINGNSLSFINRNTADSSSNIIIGSDHATAGSIYFTLRGHTSAEERFRVAAAGAQLIDGTVSAPGLSFVNDPDNGIYRVGTNDWALVKQGVRQIRFTSSVMELQLGNLTGQNPNINFLSREGSGGIAAQFYAANAGSFRARLGGISATGASSFESTLNVFNRAESVNPPITAMALSGSHSAFFYGRTSTIVQIGSLTGTGVSTGRPQLRLASVHGNISADAMVSGSALGEIDWAAWDNAGATSLKVMSIRGLTGGTIASGQIPSSMHFDTMDNGGTFAERMQISRDGNVGIGVTPDAASIFHVQRDQNSVTCMRLVNDTAGTAAYAELEIASNSSKMMLRAFDDAYVGTVAGINIADHIVIGDGGGVSAGGMLIHLGSNAPMIFATNALERMRILGTGEVGMGGTPTAGDALTVYQALTASDALVIKAAGDSTGGWLYRMLDDNGAHIGGFKQLNQGATEFSVLHYGEGTGMGEGSATADLKIARASSNPFNIEFWGASTTSQSTLYLGQTLTNGRHVRLLHRGAGMASDGLITAGSAALLVMETGGATSNLVLGVENTTGASIIFATQGHTTSDERLRIANDGGLQFTANTAAVSASNTGRIRYNGTDDYFEVSENAGSYAKVVVGSGQAYEPTNVSTNRSFDANDTTLDEIADVLGTLIADLQTARAIDVAAGP